MLKPSRLLQILFTLALTTGAGSLKGHSHPAAGHFALSADFLYLLPSVDDTYFAIPSSNTSGNSPAGSGTRENNDFEFTPAFRVGGWYRFPGCGGQEAEIYYSRLSANTNRTVEGPYSFTVPFYGINSLFTNVPGFVSSSLSCLYQRIDGVLTQPVFHDRGFDMRVVAGVELAYIKLNERYFALNSTVTAVNSQEFTNFSKAQGLGPQFGFACDYAVCRISKCCPGTLSITGCASGSLVVSQTQEKQEGAGTSFSTVADLKDESMWRIIPAWHARVGLNYGGNFSCFGASLEVGYEFNTYVGAITRLIPPLVGSSFQTILDYRDFDTQGLYISAAVTF